MIGKNSSPREPFSRVRTTLAAGRPRKGEQALLRSIGISKKLSMQAQALASLPPALIEDVCARRLSLTAAVKIALLAKRIVREAEDA